MIKKLLSLLTIVLAFFVVFNIPGNRVFSEDQSPKLLLPEYFKTNYSGFVNNMKASLELEKDKDHLSGTLDYQDKDKFIEYYVSGSIDVDDSFTLKLVDSTDGKKSGSFKGTLKDHKLNGFIIKNDGSKLLFTFDEELSELPATYKANYDGSIGDDDIVITLVKSDSNITGSYLITKTKEKISFSGKIDKYGLVNLIESSDKSPDFSVVGSLNEYMLNAIWVSADKKKILQFWGRNTE